MKTNGEKSEEESEERSAEKHEETREHKSEEKREGKIMEIARYCCFDVKVTKLVHEYGVAHGLVKFFDSAGHEKVAPVVWPTAD